MLLSEHLKEEKRKKGKKGRTTPRAGFAVRKKEGPEQFSMPVFRFWGKSALHQ